MSTSKRKAFEAILRKIQKLLPHLGNENAGQAEAARRALNRLLFSVKLDWHDITRFLSDKTEQTLKMGNDPFEKDEDAIVRLGLSGSAFFCSPEEMFADVLADGHRNTWPLSSREFEDWLLHEFFIEKKKVPSNGVMKAAIRTLSAHAKFNGARHEVYLRAAKCGDKIYLDIGDPGWHAVEVDASGWRTIQDPPVRFRRTAGMTALPLPQHGGSVELLRSLVNLNETTIAPANSDFEAHE